MHPRVRHRAQYGDGLAVESRDRDGYIRLHQVALQDFAKQGHHLARGHSTNLHLTRHREVYEPALIDGIGLVRYLLQISYVHIDLIPVDRDDNPSAFCACRKTGPGDSINTAIEN